MDEETVQTEETQETDTTEEVVEETQEVTTEEEEETEETPVEVSEEDLSLLQLLKNPGTRKAAIQSLVAESAGQVASGSASVKEVRKSLSEMLQEALGEDWKFLAEKLGPVLDKALKEEVADVRKEFQTLEEKRVLKETQEATNQLYKTYPDVKHFEQQIVQLMSKFQPDPDMPPYEYIENMYLMAKARGSKSSIANAATRRIQRNAKDPGLNLGPSTAQPKGTTQQQKMTLNDAIKLAVTQVKKAR